MSKIPVWSWTDAVAKSDVPPLTKLVCLNIARYLSSVGKGWRITVEQMASDTGMGDRAIRIHLGKAKKAGLIAIVRHHDGKGYRTATEYRPRFPDGVVLDGQPAECALPAPDAGRAICGENVAYRHVDPVGGDAGQVPIQEEEPNRKNSTRTSLVSKGADEKVSDTDLLANPLSAWGDE